MHNLESRVNHFLNPNIVGMSSAYRLNLSRSFTAPICSARAFASSSILKDIATIVAPFEMSFGPAASASNPPLSFIRKSSKTTSGCSCSVNRTASEKSRASPTRVISDWPSKRRRIASRSSLESSASNTDMARLLLPLVGNPKSVRPDRIRPLSVARPTQRVLQKEPYGSCVDERARIRITERPRSVCRRLCKGQHGQAHSGSRR